VSAQPEMQLDCAPPRTQPATGCSSAAASEHPRVQRELRGGQFKVQDRGLAAYIAELVGTLLLVFFITSVVVLYVSTGQNAQFGSDFAVVGLVHAFLLFGLVVMFGVVSGGHFNPAITLGAAA